MAQVKYELDWALRRRMPKEDWEEYQRLTEIANNPQSKDLPRTRLTYIIGFSVTVLLLVPAGISLATSTNGGASAVGWMMAVLVSFFAALIAPMFVVFKENREARERADASRTSLAEKFAPKTPARSSSRDDDNSPHYPVTGEYNPSLYMARGGRATAQWLEDSGYGDWETYEANKPD